MLPSRLRASLPFAFMVGSVAASLLILAAMPRTAVAEAAAATAPAASAAAPSGQARQRRAALIEARLAQLRAELTVNLAAQRTASGAALNPLRQREQRLREQIAELAAQLNGLSS
jgi:hypothetical protein